MIDTSVSKFQIMLKWLMIILFVGKVFVIHTEVENIRSNLHRFCTTVFCYFRHCKQILWLHSKFLSSKSRKSQTFNEIIMVMASPMVWFCQKCSSFHYVLLHLFQCWCLNAFEWMYLETVLLDTTTGWSRYAKKQKVSPKEYSPGRFWLDIPAAFFTLQKNAAQ